MRRRHVWAGLIGLVMAGAATTARADTWLTLAGTVGGGVRAGDARGAAFGVGGYADLLFGRAGDSVHDGLDSRLRWDEPEVGMRVGPFVELGGAWPGGHLAAAGGGSWLVWGRRSDGQVLNATALVLSAGAAWLQRDGADAFGWVGRASYGWLGAPKLLPRFRFGALSLYVEYRRLPDGGDDRQSLIVGLEVSPQLPFAAAILALAPR